MKQTVKQALLKHDRLVPRYTSYPTAPHFMAGASQNWFQEKLAAIPDSSAISLYIHVPFCPKLCWFCGCHTRITNHYAPVEEYLALLLAELTMLLPYISGRGLRISHLHFGGGSPTILNASDFQMLMAALQEHFGFVPDAEIAIEIDPRNINKEKVEAYAASGINRVSFGIQDFDPRVMAAVNRPQTYELDLEAINLCRDAGIEKINFDLMYGLAHQTNYTMRLSAEKALSLHPDRIALFGYAHVPWLKKHMRLLPEDALPSAEQRLELFEVAAAVFEDNGYIPVGIDHFAREGDALTAALRDHRLRRSFQGYTDDGAANLIALGASAISHFDDAYTQNLTFLPQYRDRVAAGTFPIEKYCVLDEADKLHGRIIKEMMCNLSVNPLKEADAAGLGDYDFAQVYEQLHALAEDDLVRILPDGTIHALVRQAARLVCAHFDTRLSASTQRRHVSAS